MSLVQLEKRRVKKTRPRPFDNPLKTPRLGGMVPAYASLKYGYAAHQARRRTFGLSGRYGKIILRISPLLETGMRRPRSTQVRRGIAAFAPAAFQQKRKS